MIRYLWKLNFKKFRFQTLIVHWRSCAPLNTLCICKMHWWKTAFARKVKPYSWNDFFTCLCYNLSVWNQNKSGFQTLPIKKQHFVCNTDKPGKKVDYFIWKNWSSVVLDTGQLEARNLNIYRFWMSGFRTFSIVHISTILCKNVGGLGTLYGKLNWVKVGQILKLKRFCL